MKKSTLQFSVEPDIAGDPLHELIRNGARQLIAAAVEVELEAMLQQRVVATLSETCKKRRRVASMAVPAGHIHR